MTLKKMVNGVEVLCSAEEEAAILAEWSANANAPAPVPFQVPRRQAIAALIKTGKRAQVEAALAAIPGEAGALARNDYYESLYFQRHWPLMESMKPILNWTDADLDNLFRLAAAS